MIFAYYLFFGEQQKIRVCPPPPPPLPPTPKYAIFPYQKIEILNIVCSVLYVLYIFHINSAHHNLADSLYIYLLSSPARVVIKGLIIQLFLNHFSYKNTKNYLQKEKENPRSRMMKIRGLY